MKGKGPDLSIAIIGLASLVGLVAFLYPFFLPGRMNTGALAHANDAPLVFVIVLVLCLVVVFTSLTGQQMSSKLTALLGILTALSQIAADELEGLLETAHLLRSSKNAERLLTALSRARTASLKPTTLTQLKQDAGLEA